MDKKMMIYVMVGVGTYMIFKSIREQQERKMLEETEKQLNEMMDDFHESERKRAELLLKEFIRPLEKKNEN